MKSLSNYIDGFLEMMSSERGASKNTISSYKADLEQLSGFFGGKDVSEIGTEHLRTFIKTLNKEYSKSSVARKISAMKQFFEYLMSEKDIYSNPARLIEIPKKDSRMPKFLTPAEVEKIVSCTGDEQNYESLRIKLIIGILAGSGLRVSELISLKLNSIQRSIVEGTEFYFLHVTGKGEKERIAPITKETKQILDKYVQFLENGVPWLFPSKKVSAKHLTRQQVANLLKKYAGNAGIDKEKISPHILRHSFATNILNNGMDLRSLQEILGHSDISTTQIYTHLNAPKLKSFVEENHPIAKSKT